MIAMAKFKIFNLFSTNSNAGIRCRGYASFHLWNENRRAMDRADSRHLNLLSNIVDGETELWCDSVYRSLVFHDKMLSEKEGKRLESGAEVTPRFNIWNENRRAMDRADSNLFTIIFRETLKDYGMILGERCKRSGSGAEVTPRFTCGMKTVALWIARIQILCNHL